jgi:hypothetical protein
MRLLLDKVFPQEKAIMKGHGGEHTSLLSVNQGGVSGACYGPYLDPEAHSRMDSSNHIIPLLPG